jgi:hypothetical protein
MLVYETMEACISICMCAKLSICRLSHLIPFTAWLVIEFSPTDGPKDGGKLFVQTNPLK